MIKDRAGVVGFQEDIPALIIVTVALIIFIANGIRAYSLYIAHNEAVDLARQGSEFSNWIRGYEGLVYESTKETGFFDCNKINAFAKNVTSASSKLEHDFNLRFKYKIQVLDCSNYSVKYNLEICSSEQKNVNAELEKYTSELPVCIYVNENEIHAAKLITAVWR